MIASPTDVSTERNIVRKEIFSWNDLHAARSRTVLLPLSWETHSAPQTGKRAQELINEDLLEQCDLLVAVFWTRLGSPTGKAPSGTVEEIREHVRAGKQAMIYFSEAPVVLDSVDLGQWEAVRAFRQECQKMSLFEVFDSPSDLQEKFARHLSRVVEKHFQSDVRGSEVPTAASRDAELTPVASRTRGPALSEEAIRILKAAAADSHGYILLIQTMQGYTLSIGEEDLLETGDPRAEAAWLEATDELRAQGLVRATDSKGEAFRLTREGYSVADSLP